MCIGKSACYINVDSKVDLDFIYYTFIGKEFQNYIQKLLQVQLF